jgi:hypothetical protein
MAQNQSTVVTGKAEERKRKRDFTTPDGQQGSPPPLAALSPWQKLREPAAGPPRKIARHTLAPGQKAFLNLFRGSKYSPPTPVERDGADTPDLYSIHSEMKRCGVPEEVLRHSNSDNYREFVFLAVRGVLSCGSKKDFAGILKQGSPQRTRLESIT